MRYRNKGMDIGFKFNGKARVYGADVVPMTEEIEKVIQEVLEDELGIYSDVVVSDYYQIR